MTNNVSPINARKRRPAPMRSHEDIYDLVQKAVSIAEEAKRHAADAVGRADLSHLVGQRVEKKLDALIKSVGEEGEDGRGEKVGTGAIGRLMRLETTVSKRFGIYDGWVREVVGFTAAAAILLPAIWWLVSGHLEKVLK